MTLIQCPSCGHNFEHQCRRQAGEGTGIDPDSPLSENEASLLNILREFKTAMSVREVLHHVYEKGIDRVGKPYNYHLAQIELSRLVGRGLLEMLPVGNNGWTYRIRGERLPMDEQPESSTLSILTSTTHEQPAKQPIKDLGRFV